jgi:hypothetical protein
MIRTAIGCTQAPRSLLQRRWMSVFRKAYAFALVCVLTLLSFEVDASTQWLLAQQHTDGSFSAAADVALPIRSTVGFLDSANSTFTLRQFVGPSSSLAESAGRHHRARSAGDENRG